VANEREACKKILTTLFAVPCGLGCVRAPARAIFFGTLHLERFFSCLRRICHSTNHNLNMMEMLSLAQLMAIRCRLGLTPHSEEGTKRQKCGDVLFSTLPTSAEDLPMGHVLSLVLTAVHRSLPHLPDPFPEAWTGLGGAASVGWRPVLHRGSHGPESRPSPRRVHPPQHAPCRDSRFGEGEAVGDRSSGRPCG
jgi:hypothetical protein